MQEHNNFVKNALFPLKQCTARRYRTVRLTSRMIRAVTKLAHVCALTLRVDCIYDSLVDCAYPHCGQKCFMAYGDFVQGKSRLIKPKIQASSSLVISLLILDFQ